MSCVKLLCTTRQLAELAASQLPASCQTGSASGSMHSKQLVVMMMGLPAMYLMYDSNGSVDKGHCWRTAYAVRTHMQSTGV